MATDTVAEPVRRAVIGHRLPSREWPDRVLRVTAIDVETGELVVVDRDSGVALVDAVAASCAVPGVWPPVTIGDRRFMDGGVGSTVNLTAAADCDAVVVLVPSSESSPSPFGAGAAAEIAGFPGETLAVFADDDVARRVRSQSARPGVPDPVGERRSRAGAPATRPRSRGS